MMERNMSGESESSIDWEEEVRQRYIYGVNLRSQVKSLSGLHYHEDEMSHQSFASFLDYQVQTNPHSSGQLFQIHELEAILNDNQPGKNLTNKYYSDKVLRYLRHELVKKEWLRILEGNNEEEQDLFHGAILISQWCQTNITIDEAHYRRQVELIANISIDLIKERYPNNSLSKSKDHACLTDDQAIHLRESIWSPEMCNQILYSLNEVLFTQLKFAGNRDHYFEAHNSFIHKVIDDRVGIPITLCILYQAIAAKLGVKTFAVNFPGHFLIKWKQHPE
jgi:F-box protein 21